MTTAQKKVKPNGQMFFDTEILDAYRLAKRFAGPEGHVATLPEIIAAKAHADSQGLLWTNYFLTTSGEFYGKSKQGTPIVVVAHGIDGILNDEQIIADSTKDLRESSRIKLSEKQFRDLESGKYGAVHILRVKDVNAIREFPTSAVSYGEACDEDPLLLARLGTDHNHLYDANNPALAFLRKHREITFSESGNYYILTNEFDYPYLKKREIYTGGLLHISQLCNNQRSGSDYNKSSVSTDIDVANLSSAGRFIAVMGNESLKVAGDALEDILSNLGKHWKKISVPNTKVRFGLYTLVERGNKTFVVYEKDGDGMDSGLPEFSVQKLTKIGKPQTFKTTIGGYHGFFKYGVDEVEKLAPDSANAYMMGEPAIEYEGNNPVNHIAPVQFYQAEVDQSLRILKPEELKDNIDLVKKLVR